MEEFGEIEECHMQIVGLWQKAKITYKQEKEAFLAQEKWSTFIGKDSVRIIPAINTADVLHQR